MLSRTASCIFWMARYMERAENTARMVDVSHQMSLLPGAGNDDLLTPLLITGSLDHVHAARADSEAEAILYALTLDPDNPASIYNCIRNARENARVVRGKITSEMWENLNATWLELRGYGRADLRGAAASRLFDWVKERSHLFRGVTYGTILRNDAFHFARLGTFIERADSTARILNIKFHRITHSGQAESVNDYYQWAALLRSACAFEAYREIYRDRITPERVVEMLILRPDVPRSLRACFDEISHVLPAIAGKAGHDAKRLAAEIHARLKFARVEEVFAQGLSNYLGRLIDDTNLLGERIYHAYLEAA